MRQVVLIVLAGFAVCVGLNMYTSRRMAHEAREASSSTEDLGTSSSPYVLDEGDGSVSGMPTSVQATKLPWDQEIYFDDDGLIVQAKRSDGRWDGGDTAQREGFYWLGVWIRENILHQPWPYKRSLTFDQVLSLLEHKTDGKPDGVFYRHPKIPPYNDPWDKEWGFSRDQMVPLVAAMGVYGKYDTLQRLWAALPQDYMGKHTFNGRWEAGPISIPGVRGIPAPDCDSILKQSCDMGPCPGVVEQKACQISHPDPPPCLRPPDPPECPGFFGIRDPGCVQTRNQTISAINGGVGACQSTRDIAIQGLQTARAACLSASKVPCEERKVSFKIACETTKRVTWAACAVANHYTGDLVELSTLNLFRRALDENPMTLKVYDPPLPASQGAEGEIDLAGGTELRIRQAEDRDNVGDDLNLIVILLMSKLRYETPLSAGAISRYARSRPHSYGSYLLQNYAKYGGDTEDIKNRIKSNGWYPDIGVSPALGALRWYNRPPKANPRLADLYAPILAALIR